MTHRFPGPQFAVSHESIRTKQTVLKVTPHKFQISRQIFPLHFGKGKFGGKKLLCKEGYSKFLSTKNDSSNHKIQISY
jgi:hypothetical protein